MRHSERLGHEQYQCPDLSGGFWCPEKIAGFVLSPHRELVVTRQRVDDLAEFIRDLRVSNHNRSGVQEIAALMAERMLLCVRIRELQANDSRNAR